MRKNFLLILALMLVSLIGLAACGHDEEVYIITDRFFTRQVTSAQTNPQEYLGRTVQFNGMFMSEVCDVTNDIFFFVGQQPDDCCGGGFMGPIGFEIYLGNTDPVEENAWVQVIGVFEHYVIPGFDFPILRVNVRTMVPL